MVGYKVPLNTDLGSDAKKVQKEEQRRIDEADELTEQEQEEKEDLLQQVNNSCLLSLVHRGYFDKKLRLPFL